MPFLRKSPTPPRGVMTVNGNRQPRPEGSGAIERRFRLFMECVRRLVDDPLSSASSIGVPIGDGAGLEELSARIAPLFDHEPSLLRWVALRGAIADIYIYVLDPTSAVVPQRALEEAMGLEWRRGPEGESQADLREPWRTQFSGTQRKAAMGIASSIMIRAEDYPRYSKMRVQDVNSDPRCCRMSRPLALDTIAWVAVALLRLEVAQQLLPQVPEPDALPEPGWYVEPLFSKGERYWDGSDWTAACRMQDGRRYIENEVPLT